MPYSFFKAENIKVIKPRAIVSKGTNIAVVQFGNGIMLVGEVRHTASEAYKTERKVVIDFDGDENASMILKNELVEYVK